MNRIRPPLHAAVFFITLVFLPSQLGYHVWPEWSFVLGRRVDFLSPTLYFTDILIIITVATWLIHDSGYVFSTIRTQIKNPATRFAGVCLTMYIILNIYLSGMVYSTLYHALKFFEFGMWFWYILRSQPKATTVFTGLLAGAVWSSLIGIIQSLLQKSIGGVMWLVGERRLAPDAPGIAISDICLSRVAWGRFFTRSGCTPILRAYSTFPHPNVLGGYLSATLTWIYFICKHRHIYVSEISRRYQVVRHKSRLLYVILGSSALVIGICMVLTFSRSAWIAAVFGVLYFMLRGKQPDNDKNRIHGNPKFQVLSGRRNILFLTIIIFIFGTGLLIRPDLKGESAIERRFMIRQSIAVWLKSPLTGVGFGQYIRNISGISGSQTVLQIQPVHNIYLLFLAESGILGYLFVWWYAFRIFRSGDLHTGLNRSLLPAAIIFGQILLIGMLDHYFLTLQQGQMMLILFSALTVNSLHRSPGSVK